MPELILIRGLPGSGKSTFANIISNFNFYVVISADMYFENKNGDYCWNKNELNKAHLWCQENVERLMNDFSFTHYYIQNNKGLIKHFGSKNKIIVANTFTTEKELEPYYKLAKNYNYQVTSVIVENRHNGKSIHNVPKESIEKMKNRFVICL